jgi:hypothetical protein
MDMIQINQLSECDINPSYKKADTMEKIVRKVKDISVLIDTLKQTHGVRKNNITDPSPLLFTGVIDSEKIGDITPVVKINFGEPFKAAGEKAFMKNLFNSFARSIGGMQVDQTVFRKEIGPGLTLFCSFWPWASNPDKTSVRLGLLCKNANQEIIMADQLSAYFG